VRPSLGRLEKEGEARVQANYEAHPILGTHGLLVAEWLYDKAFERAGTEQEKRDLALDAVRRSAACRTSGGSKRRNARWTFGL
jgi:hypothetical protein